MKLLDVRRAKPYVLPLAILLGLLMRKLCMQLSPVVPYLIFAILILTFSTVKLRELRFGKLNLWLALFQVAATAVLYYLFKLVTSNETIAEGMMMGALCPVASSVTVVAGVLGANRSNTISYTIVGNLVVCLIAPIVFVALDSGDGAVCWTDSFFAVVARVSAVIGLPFLLAFLMQRWTPSLSEQLGRIAGLSFYLWAVALFLTLGQTIGFVFEHGQGQWVVIVTLAAGSAVICPLQFSIGRLIGRHFGDSIAGQQLLGQKNSAIGIWMSNTYLNPLASVFLAFYSIWQNIINSWQIYDRERKKIKK